jgi:serine/threonine-protein kinase
MGAEGNTQFYRAGEHSSEIGVVTDSGLPFELLRTARRRVAQLSLFVLVLSVIGVILFYPLMKEIYEASTMKGTPAFMMGTLVVASILLFASTRIQRIPEQLLLDLALIYEVLLAFATALARHSIPWQEGINRDWSEVAVWIIVFSVVIPNTPGKSFLAASLAALTDPIGLLISIANGNPMPSLQMLGHLFGPTFFSVILAAFLSRLIFRMGKDIQRAKRMGGYQLLRKLGTGGMGEVWLARHHMLARPAAVKVISKKFLSADSLDSGDTVLKRFEREAKATAILESEHTIRLFDFGATQDGSFYYVMEFLNGLNLEELVSQFGPVLPERAVYLLIQVCGALEEAHADNMIHRDIKPANIFVCKKGLQYDFVKVLDFGLVRNAALDGPQDTRLTADGRIPGTPAYLPPEAVSQTLQMDARADIYSLGCVAYWLLSGALVFEETDPLRTILDHVNTEPALLSTRTELPIPPELDELVRACLEKQPDRRPQSVGELSQRLKELEFLNKWSQERAESWWKINLPSKTQGRPAEISSQAAQHSPTGL